MDRTIIEIKDTYITLGQFLKLADVISSGGMAKPFLQQMEVFVNDELENRRGKKLYDKRQDLKEKDDKRAMDRIKKAY